MFRDQQSQRHQRLLATTPTSGTRQHESENLQRRSPAPDDLRAAHAAADRRSSWQQGARARVPSFGLSYQHDDDAYEGDRRRRRRRAEEEQGLIGSRESFDSQDEEAEEEEEEQDWRQAAQMLTERDEMLLLSSRQPRSSDVIDAAPLNRRLQQANQRARRSPLTPTLSPTTESSQNQPQQQQQKLTQRMDVFTSHKQAVPETKKRGKEAGKSTQVARRPFSWQQQQQDQQQQAEDDDNSSISFAQSGCHSILSAWRIKAANKAARLAAASRASGSTSQQQQQQQHQERPMSVLSNASSTGKKSAASTAYTARSSLRLAGQVARIQLGPKQAQHFVTNSRRRRRANELIMNTLEARKRALLANRQNLGSLFGSESFLGGGARVPAGSQNYAHQQADKQMLLLNDDDEYEDDLVQRLSMSPSPLPGAARSPSPFSVGTRARYTPSPSRSRPVALSDLGVGGRASPALVAQRNKLLAQVASEVSTKKRRPPLQQQQVTSRKRQDLPTRTFSHSSLGSASFRPPLAKLDQNSSDMCSSNDSSSGNDESPRANEEESSSDAGSQFTHLVTSELTPSLLMLETGSQEYLRGSDQQSKTRSAGSGSSRRAVTTTTTARASKKVRPLGSSRPSSSRPQLQAHARPQEAPPPPRPPKNELQQQQQQQLARQQVERASSQQQQQVSTSEEDDKNGNGSKLRRGALKRDSIRRLRLKKQQRGSFDGDDYNQSPVAASNQSSSFDSYESREHQQQQQQQRQREQQEAAAAAAASQNLRPLSKARKLDIENNPFLNRHHFRTLSTRSSDSRQSLASQQQVAGRRAEVPTSTNEDDERTDRETRAISRARVGSARSASTSSRNERARAQATIASEPTLVRSQQQRTHVSAPMPQVDEENIRQVERMLRNMKPNEVLRSKSREVTTSQSGQVGSRSYQQQQQQQPLERVEAQKPRGAGETSGENVFKTTTRLVREGAKSSDDLKFDLAGSRQQRQLSERWRHEHIDPVRLRDGTVVSEQRLLTDRVEVLRQRELSPPPEFSDAFADQAPVRPRRREDKSPAPLPSRQLPEPQRQPQQRQQEQREPFKPTLPPRPSDRFAGRSSTSVDESRFIAAPLRPSVAEDRRPTALSRARSEERATAGDSTRQAQLQAGKPPIVPRTSKPKSQVTQLTSQSNPSIEKLDTKPLNDAVKVLQASLPKFERTADDEFRKRVDQLRQMARANLEASEARQAQEAKWHRDKMSLVKPMSTNWDGPTKGSTTSDAPTAAAAASISRARSPPLTSRNLSKNLLLDDATATPARAGTDSSQKNGRAVATDLDDVLLSHRYQRPLSSTARPVSSAQRPQEQPPPPPPVGAWRRSNSSLASLGAGTGSASATASKMKPPARPMSPPFGVPRAQTSAATPFSGGYPPARQTASPASSVLSIEPRGDHASATPMRVVVREKSAPRLDFAIVEQRPPTRVVRAVPEARPLSPVEQRPRTLPLKPMPPPPTNQQQQQQRTTAQSSAARSVASRSPEFGQAAASSNDDSAIASSVSSPSPLSNYVASLPQRPAAPPSLATATSGSSAAARAPVITTSLDQPSAASNPTLQSILRRQQMTGSLSGPPSGYITESGRFTPVSYFPASQSPPPQTSRTSHFASQQQEEAPKQSDQQQSSPPKRVHFNDRTSIRSFESISSTASNTTAIQQQQQQQQHQHQSSDLDDFSARQQVGSPDSMGSGSTSRLSSDSPAFGDFRRGGGSGGGGGAAIYAVRGDPELEQTGQQSPVDPSPQRQLKQLAGQQQHSFYPGQLPVSQQLLQQQQQHPSVPYGNQLAYTSQQARQPPQQLYQQQQQQQPLSSPSLAGAIRMTDPPIIKTNPQSGPPSSYPMMLSPTQSARTAPMLQQQQQQQQVSPHSFMGQPRGTAQFQQQQQQTVVMVAPQQQQQQRPAHHSLVTEALDEDDPDYALRLRQAATRRAFSYVQPTAGIPVQQQQQQQQASVNTSASGTSQMMRRQRPDLANFQTEV